MIPKGSLRTPLSPQLSRAARLAQMCLGLLMLLAGCTSLGLPDGAAAAVPPFDAVQAIWPQPALPDEPEVALFRNTFRVPEGIDKAALEIFADTRYQAWLDGQWLGSGPARFSTHFREYDRLDAGPLAPGEHTLAVLAQWAPNIRRSESQTPLLMARLVGQARAGAQTLAETGPSWKAWRSPAWQSGAAPVDIRQLIGPTELLDLQRLPSGWTQPGYNDAGWTGAYRVFLPAGSPSVSRAAFQARSIPRLEQAPIPIQVVENGALAPGRRLLELPAGSTDPWQLDFKANKAVNFSLETLEESLPALSGLLLDDEALEWKPVGAQRPAVYRAEMRLGAGDHRLWLEQPPADGAALTISSRNLELPDTPFGPTLNAGRRLLLADRAAAADFVQARRTADGLEIDFPAQPGYAILDLGRTIHGRLLAQAQGPAGAVLDVGWDERLRGDPPELLPYPGPLNPFYDQVDSWTLDGSPRQIATLDDRSGRYLLLANPAGGKLRLSGLQALEERYPVSSQGYFQSSDPLLDRIWQTGVDTLRPNLTDAFTDTPWRERGQWWGDVHIASQAAQASLGGTDPLLRRGLLLMADAIQTGSPAPAMVPNNDQQHILDYALLWASDLADYSERTGDLETARQAYPALQSMLAHAATYALPESGLLYLEQGHWSNTAYIDTNSPANRYGASTALNALYYTSLLRAAGLASQLGDTAQATDWQAAAARVRASANRLLYLPESGRYAATSYNGWLIKPSVQAQAYALAAGLPPETESQRVARSLLEMARLENTEQALQMPGMYQATAGLARAGQVGAALDLVRQNYGSLLKAGATTWWENFQVPPNFQDSLSHAWGSSPTWLLSTYVLGARRSGPQSWQVHPALGSLEWAAGAIPLPQGLLQVRWEALPAPAGSAACTYRIAIVAPASTQGQVILPGQPTFLPPGVAAAPLGDEWVVDLGAGQFTLEAPARCP